MEKPELGNSDTEEVTSQYSTEDTEPLLVEDFKDQASTRSKRQHFHKPKGLSGNKTRRWTPRRGFICLTAILFLSGLFVTYFLSIRKNGPKSYHPSSDNVIVNYRQLNNSVSFDNILYRPGAKFEMRGRDVMVFLHIQKTGGTTFGKHLVQDLRLERNCECSKRLKNGRKRKLRCNCLRPGTGNSNWLFSRYSTGWKCGLHPDWTELTGCVDTYLKAYERDERARRYFYITFLRDPVSRYLSEYRHVERGATWKTATYSCKGKSWADYIPKCYGNEAEDWSGVSIQDFMACPHNLAVNRQTRMLADLELVSCYNMTVMEPEKRDRILLASAKANLENMAFFGLTEEQKISQYMFEATFGMEFLTTFEQFNVTWSSATQDNLDHDILNQIRELNYLDEELYQFAHKLLLARYEEMKEWDKNFLHHMERLEHKKRKDFISWKDIEEEEEDPSEDDDNAF